MKVMNIDGKLGFARETPTKPMLRMVKEVLRVEEINDVRVNDVFHEFARYAGQGDWLVIQR